MYTQISVRGDDAISFLQGQLTQDLGTVSAKLSPLAAWCNPRGRVITTMRLLQLADGIGMIVPAALAQRIVDGLTRYRLRAKLTMQIEGDDWQAAAIADERDLATLDAAGLLPGHGPGSSVNQAELTAVSQDSARNVVEIYGPLATAGLILRKPLTPAAWQTARIAAGLVDINEASSEKYTPHMLNLDRQGAISFSKGCYAGQEIVARTEHLGNAKRRLATFRSSAPLPPGERLELDGTSVGNVIASSGDDLLVLLPVELHAETLNCGPVKIRPSPPQASGRM